MPVAILICVGFAVAKFGVITEFGAQELTRLTFNVLAPALLFHTMSLVHLQELKLDSVLLYFFVALSLFGTTIFLLGFNRRSTVLALASTYSNTTMIGVPLIGLVYGAPGLVYLFTLISVHAIILLTTATVVLELSLLKERANEGDGTAGGAVQELQARHFLSPWGTVLKALRNATLHPVPLPIVAGVVFAHFGWQLPALLEQPIVLVGSAFSPLALMLVGISLYSSINWQGKQILPQDAGRTSEGDRQGAHAARRLSVWHIASILSVMKNLFNPLLVLFLGKLFGVQGLALSVMVLASSMPIGANVFLFSQRYKVAETEITIAVSSSTLAALLTVPFVIWVSDTFN